jgi:hypothetical protein
MIVNVMDKIQEGIWLGNIKAAEDKTLLKVTEITHVLSLGAIPSRVDSNIKHMKIHIDDIPSAQIYQHLDRAVDFITEAVN